MPRRDLAAKEAAFGRALRQASLAKHQDEEHNVCVLCRDKCCDEITSLKAHIEELEDEAKVAHGRALALSGMQHFLEVANADLRIQNDELETRNRDLRVVLTPDPALGPIGVFQCRDCGESWPHPSVLSTRPRCQSCQRKLVAHIEELEAALGPLLRKPSYDTAGDTVLVRMRKADLRRAAELVGPEGRTP